MSAAVSDKEENLDKNQLELLYRNDRYVCVSVSLYCVCNHEVNIDDFSTTFLILFLSTAITGDSQYVPQSLSLLFNSWQGESAADS